MKKLFRIGAVVLFGHIAGVSHAQAGENIDQAWVTQNLTSMPLAFTQNMGQWDERALFRANAGGATMWITTEGVYYQFTRWIPGNGNPPQAVGHPDDPDMASVGRNQPASGGFDNAPDSIETMVIKAAFVGANPSPTASGGNLLDYKCNYFLGNDPAKWRTDVPNYEAITLEAVYPGIDLTYYGNGRQMEYDFVVGPGADYSQIQIQYEGAEGLTIADDGALVVTTKWGEIKELAPVVYQEIGGSRRPVASEYVVQSGHTFGFSLGKDYDRALPLVIDPVLVYSTYLGGSSGDYSYGIAVTSSGDMVVAGFTSSLDFPLSEPIDASQSGTMDAFVTKFASNGGSPLFSTYIGGNGQDGCYDVALDETDDIYITGYTLSNDFPIVEPYAASLSGECDVFVTVIGASGSSIQYSTYLGGGGYAYDDVGNAIAVGEDGIVYVVGQTKCADFPTVNAYDAVYNYQEAFLAKLLPEIGGGGSLAYSTFLGGSGEDNAWDVCVDVSGCAYITGVTGSPDFPVKNAYDGSWNGYGDIFVTKFTSGGDALVFSTFVGGSKGDWGYGIGVDSGGDIYVSGTSQSEDFPTVNPFDDHIAGRLDYDAVLLKLAPSGETITYSTYLGGDAGREGGGHVVIGNEGIVYLAGYTESSDFPLVDPCQVANGGGWDVFVAAIAPAIGDTGSLLFSTYLGGNGDDRGHGIKLNNSGSPVITGWTNSPGFPTVNPFQMAQGQYDAFVSVVSTELLPHIAMSASNLSFAAVQGGDIPNPETLTLTNTGGGTLDWYVDEQIPWLDLDVWQGSSNNAEITVSINTTDLEPGTYTGDMTVSSSNADNSPQTVAVSYQVLDNPAEVAQFYFLKDRLENLKIDLFEGLAIPLANSYELDEANAFVDSRIRPGVPTGNNLAAFNRLLMALKLANAGYRYAPVLDDPLPETDQIDGAEVMWDAGVKNTIRSVLSGVSLVTFFGSLVDMDGPVGKFVAKLIAKALNFVIDLAAQLKRFIPDEDRRRTVDLLIAEIKVGISKQLSKKLCLSCLLAEPVLRPVADEIALNAYHVPKTQGSITNAGIWATQQTYSNPQVAAEAAFQTNWDLMKSTTDDAKFRIADYEAQASSAAWVNQLQELFDTWGTTNFIQKTKMLVSIMRGVLGVDAVSMSMCAAAEGFSTAPAVKDLVNLGIEDIFGEGRVAVGAQAAVNGLDMPLRKSDTPSGITDFAIGAQDLIEAIQAGDSTVIYATAEQFYQVTDSAYGVLQGYVDSITCRVDAGWVSMANFDSLLAKADSARIDGETWLLQSYAVAAGAQLAPFDAELKASMLVSLDSAKVRVEVDWNTINDVLTAMVGLTKSPALVTRATVDNMVVNRDSVFTVDFVSMNVGDIAALNSYAKAMPADGVTMSSTDSVHLGDVAPGQTVAFQFDISLDSATMHMFKYETTPFVVGAYCSNGIGYIQSVPLTGLTTACCVGRVGDANGSNEPTDEVTLGDIMLMVDAKFISGDCSKLPCLAEADVNQDGGATPNCDDHVTLGDIMMLVDFLFITGPETAVLPECL